MNINKVAFGIGHIMADNSAHYEDRPLTDKEQLEYLEKIINNAPEDKFELNKESIEKDPATKEKIVRKQTDCIFLKNDDSFSLHQISGKKGQQYEYAVSLMTRKELEGTWANAWVIIADNGSENPKLTEMFDKLVKTFIKKPESE